MAQQSAVEWLIQELEKFHHPTEAMIMYAKKLERQQHSKTWDEALRVFEARGHNFVRAWEDFDEWYETYGSKGNVFLEDYEQINQDNPVTRGSTALVKISKPSSSQTEISDEEIEKSAIDWYEKEGSYKPSAIALKTWLNACKWYREQLKK